MYCIHMIKCSYCIKGKGYRLSARHFSEHAEVPDSFSMVIESDFSSYNIAISGVTSPSHKEPITFPAQAGTQLYTGVTRNKSE